MYNNGPCDGDDAQQPFNCTFFEEVLQVVEEVSGFPDQAAKLQALRSSLVVLAEAVGCGGSLRAGPCLEVPVLDEEDELAFVHGGRPRSRSNRDHERQGRNVNASSEDSSGL